MSVGLINRIMNKLADYVPQFYYYQNIGDTLFDSTSSNPWICPANGFVVLTPALNTSGATGYWYIMDKVDTGLPVGTVTGPANGTTYTATFPVIKGHQYYTSAKSAIDYHNARFFAF